MLRRRTKNLKSSRSRFAALTQALVAGAALFAAGTPAIAQAQTQVDCSTLPNPLYFPATTLLQSLLDKVGPILSDPSKMGAGNNITVVYLPKSSCDTYELNRTQAPLSGVATYYSTAGVKSTCSLNLQNQIPADLSAMDVGGKTCRGVFPVPRSLKEFPSYVETLGFVVPRTSTQTAITASEGFYLMRYAGRAPSTITPWNDASKIHVRSGASSTQLSVGAAIGLPGKAWDITLDSNSGSSKVRDKVSDANGTSFAEQTIGILNSSKWESRVDTMKVLAFQPFYGCRGAFFPDSTPDARDKINVRDGHYPIWTNLRFIARVNNQGAINSPNGAASSARTKRFIDIMTGAVTEPAIPLFNFIVETGNIPNCAMYVKRDVDGGPISPYNNPNPCHCAFEAARGVNNPDCVSCTSSATCNGGTCRQGFCEAR